VPIRDGPAPTRRLRADARRQISLILRRRWLSIRLALTRPAAADRHDRRSRHLLPRDRRRRYALRGASSGSAALILALAARSARFLHDRRAKREQRADQTAPARAANERFLRRILFLPEQRSTIAFDLDALHYAVILITMAGATFITLIGGWFLIRYRRRPQDDVRPNPGARSRPPLKLEAAALLGLGALFLAFWYVGVRQFVRIRIAPEGALDVYVTGKQWMWKFAYPEGPSSISTLYVPPCPIG
jgi:hypothetical protein